MYLKLALRNVRKSYKEFLIYFLTLMFSVSLFYTFNSFQAQQEMMVFQEAQDTIMKTVSIFMSILSVFIIAVLAFLILYANRFLIKQRKKEFGLYILMGMENRNISRILVYETFFIGLLSLFCGLILGFCLSQALALFTANLLSVEVSFRFVFSTSAMWISITSFSAIFLILMLFNTRVLRKQRLIDLLSASKKREKQQLTKMYLSVIIFLISIVLLSVAYYLATASMISFALFFIVIIFCGILGTLLFFFSLSGFLLRFIQVSKRLYYRNLNMFVLRSIHERINTNYISMSFVCLMLLLSIGALSTGWNLNAGMKQSFERTTPYDVSLLLHGDSSFHQINYEKEDVSFVQEMDMYNSGIKVKELLDLTKEDSELFIDEQILIWPYSQYVEFCEEKNEEPIALSEESYMLFTEMPFFQGNVHTHNETGKKLQFGAYSLTPIPLDDPYLLPYTVFSGNILAGVIVQDQLLNQDMPIVQRILNMNLQEGVELSVFTNHIKTQLQDIDTYWQLTNRDEITNNSLSMGVLFTYIGLYLGIVFLISSAVILALQQLSQAQENRYRYEILRKIGAEEKLMNASIFQQIAIYFLLPLILAMIHAYFGIMAVSSSFSLIFAAGNIVSGSLVTGGIIIGIYGAYFFITYLNYKRILNENIQ